jgi:FlaA1/EpsC-like NDP-sugar epimerase
MGPSTLRPLVLRHQRALKLVADATAWWVSLFLALVARYDLAGVPQQAPRWWLLAVLAVTVQWSAGLLLRLYRGRYRFGGFEEVAGVLRVVLLTGAVLLAVDILAGSPRIVPLSVVPGAALVALTLMSGVRYVWRLVLERRRRPRVEGATRLLVFGAGDGGSQMVASMLRTADSPYYPVGFLDDDHSKRYLRINGVPVLGGRGELAKHAQRTSAQGLLIAIPSASATLIRELSTLAEQVALPVKVLPPVRELFDDRAGLGDIRDIDLEDLLGRRRIETDVASIAGYLTGKRVLVTGAGGSIGSELSRQIQQYGPARLLMLDRDESALHAVQLSMTGRALLDSPDLLLADIRDSNRVNALFAEHRPEFVFHAAALKHLPLLEQHPGEAVKTNVWGSLTVLEAAAAVGVTRLVNISTDKAADPISVLGYSKRIAERLTATVAASARAHFLASASATCLAAGARSSPPFKPRWRPAGRSR